MILMKTGLPPLMEPTMAARTMCFDIPRACWSETILSHGTPIPIEQAKIDELTAFEFG